MTEQMTDEKISIIIELIANIVRPLVDFPDKVLIRQESGEKMCNISIHIDKSDVGKVIGREGTVITAIRQIAEKVATKNGKRVSIHVID